MQDKEIKCIGVDRDTPCPYGATFIHSVKGQEFYKEKGFEAPKRCRDCREAKREIKDNKSGGFDHNVAHGERRDNRGNRREWDRNTFGGY